MDPPQGSENKSTMSSPAAQLPTHVEGSKPSNNMSQSSTQLKPEDSTSHGSAKDKLQAFISSVRSAPDGKCFDMLGSDGVWRNIQWLPTPPDQPSEVEVYDAKPMSPELIKLYLDTRPWRQEVEDRFRGVDGREVPEE
jgi:hypothetical protein